MEEKNLNSTPLANCCPARRSAEIPAMNLSCKLCDDELGCKSSSKMKSVYLDSVCIAKLLIPAAIFS
jgi:hypothetical protein